jgi:uncharacterized Zn finger protein (UPF0148 family)
MLLESNSIPVPTQLAQKLATTFKSWGVSAAVFVQQLHYWTLKESGEQIDGKRWIYNSYEKWRNQLRWLTDYGFRKIKQLLIDEGIILVKQLRLREQGRDRTCWYAINYEHEYLQGLILDSTDGEVDCATDGEVDCATNHIETKITANSSSETTTEEVVVNERKGVLEEESTDDLTVGNQKMNELPEEDVQEWAEDNFSDADLDYSWAKKAQLNEIRRSEIPLSETLQKSVWAEPVEVVDDAIAAFLEQQEKGNVQCPTAFLIKAIQERWKPAKEVKKQQEIDEYNAWYAQNKHRVQFALTDSIYTGLPDGQIAVMLRGSDKWVYWREITDRT